MYKKFFGLQSNPFNVNPDPRYLFTTRHTEEALACLQFGVQTRKGFVLLTGEVGTGKTTLLNKFMEWLRLQRASTAFIFNPRMNVTEFLEYMMADFGVACDSSAKSYVLLRLNRWLLERYRAGETAVLIVDEAQNLSDQVLEEVRLLTNLETASEKLLQIVLAGQSELEQKLKRPHLRQLRQRIMLRAKTQPFTLEETESYMRFRLSVAGAAEPGLFDRMATSLIYDYSHGIPRIVNLICEHCLVTAFAEGQPRVDASIVDTVSRDLDLVPGAEEAMMKPPVVADQLDLREVIKMLAAGSAAQNRRFFTKEKHEPNS